MKKPKIFIACDTTNLNKVKKIIKESRNTKIKIGYKFGLEFMNSKKGRLYLSTLKNKIIFVDLKLNTCEHNGVCCKSIKRFKN